MKFSMEKNKLKILVDVRELSEELNSRNLGFKIIDPVEITKALCNIMEDYEDSEDIGFYEEGTLDDREYFDHDDNYLVNYLEIEDDILHLICQTCWELIENNLNEDLVDDDR